MCYQKIHGRYLKGSNNACLQKFLDSRYLLPDRWEFGGKGEDPFPFGYSFYEVRNGIGGGGARTSYEMGSPLC